MRAGADGDRVGFRLRIVIAAAIGIGYFLLASELLRSAPPGFLAGDFTWYWRAARAVLAGENPYEVIQATGPYPFDGPFYYPFPAALVMLPFGWLSVQIASAVFTGLSAALLAFAVTKHDLHRLPLFLSLPALWSVQSGQWAPLLTAACLLPWFGFTAAAKPNLGLAALAYSLDRRALIGVLALTVVSLIILPSWPRGWSEAVASTPFHDVPLRVVGGPLLLLALLRWRRPEGRLLFVLACVPQSMYFYDQLPLFLVSRTLMEASLLAILSHAAGLLVIHIGQPPAADGWEAGRLAYLEVSRNVIVYAMYFPALLMLLRRPNEGTVPPMLERTVGRADTALRQRLGALRRGGSAPEGPHGTHSGE